MNKATEMGRLNSSLISKLDRAGVVGVSVSTAPSMEPIGVVAGGWGNSGGTLDGSSGSYIEGLLNVAISYIIWAPLNISYKGKKESI